MAEQQKMKVRIVIRTPTQGTQEPEAQTFDEPASSHFPRAGWAALALASIVLTGTAGWYLWPRQPEIIELADDTESAVGRLDSEAENSKLTRSELPTTSTPETAAPPENLASRETALGATPGESSSTLRPVAVEAPLREDLTAVAVDRPSPGVGELTPAQPELLASLPGDTSASNPPTAESLTPEPAINRALAAASSAPASTPSKDVAPVLPAPVEPVAALAPTTAADTSSSTSSLEHALEPPDAQVDRSETVGADSDFAGVETTSPASQASQELASDTAAPEGAVAPRPAATESAANLPETTTGLNEIQSDHLLRAQLSWGIYRREPTDTVGESVEISGPGSRKIYYFTAIQGMRGETVRHRWVYQGRTMANVRFLIGGDRWRVYSSKNLSPQMTGTWQVWVEDANGKSLGRREFRVEPASASE